MKKASPGRQGLPVLLHLNKKRVLVVGATPAAVSAVCPCLEEGARVQLLVERLPPELKSRIGSGTLSWTPRPISRALIKQVDLVYVATGSGGQDRNIQKMARSLDRWVAGEESESEGDMALSSVIRRGPLTMGFWLFPGGPWLKRWIWRRLLRQWGEEWEPLLQALLQSPKLRRLGSDWKGGPALAIRIPRYLRELRRNRRKKIRF